MKSLKFYLIIIWISLLTISSQSCQTISTASTSTNEREKIIKVLAIGNSFSEDAIENNLYDLAKADNKKIIIGNLVIGGASLDLHWDNAYGDKEAYDYRKIDETGNKTKTAKTSISYAIADEDWDYISFQQVSSNSGKYETFVIPLPLLYNYVNERATNRKVKYILHQTWAYAKDSNHSQFVNYDNNQMKMYNAIVETVWKAKKLVPIDLVIPVGTAIQNARSSYLGDTMCRDGYHLDLNIGRYIAACTWYEMLFNTSVVGNTYKPDKLNELEAELAQNAAHKSVKKPRKITNMAGFRD